MKKHQISEEDLKEFQESVKNVKPLKKQKRHVLISKPKEPAPYKNKRIIYEKPSDVISQPDAAAEEIIQFARSGLQHKILRQLNQGHFPIEAELDLHGMTSEQAGNTLLEFIEFCRQRNFRCIRIIHGKGHAASTQPILKNKVNRWLRQLPAVLAFHSAKHRDGGAGAVYVLLKHGDNF